MQLIPLIDCERGPAIAKHLESRRNLTRNTTIRRHRVVTTYCTLKCGTLNPILWKILLKPLPFGSGLVRDGERDIVIGQR